MEIRTGDHAIVLDAGSGIRDLRSILIPDGPRALTVFITHTHWDHIQGFPFFVPAYVPGACVARPGLVPLDVLDPKPSSTASPICQGVERPPLTGFAGSLERYSGNSALPPANVVCVELDQYEPDVATGHRKTGRLWWAGPLRAIPRHA